MAAANRFADQFRGGLDVREVLGGAEGYVALAGAMLQCAATPDPDWRDREPGAAAFWCDVAGLDRAALRDALRRWQAEASV